MNQTPIRGAWLLLLVLTLLNILNFADRYVIVAFSSTIVTELGLSNFQFGLMTGVIFLSVYLFAGIVSGTLADRMHRPRLIAMGVAVWSALTAATGMTYSFTQMALTRIFIGVGEASLTPTATSMIADAYPPSRRALPYGIFYWGIPVGVGGAYIFAAAFGPVFGWRACFFVLGAIGVALALILLLMRDIPRARYSEPIDHQVGNSAPKGIASSLNAVWGLARSSPAFALTLMGACATTFVQGSSVLDLLWWVKERGYIEAQAQQYSGLMFLVGGLIGGVVGGVGGDIARRMTPAGDLKFLAWAMVVAIPMSIAYRYVAPATPLFYLLGFSGSVLFMFYFGPISSAFQEQIPNHLRGTATGVIVVVTTLSSAIGSALVGLLADLMPGWGSPTPITSALRICQCVGLIAIPCYLLAARIITAQTIAGTRLNHNG